MGNHEWTVQNNSQHWVHKTQYEDKQIYMKNIFMWRKKSTKIFLFERIPNRQRSTTALRSFIYQFSTFSFQETGHNTLT